MLKRRRGLEREARRCEVKARKSLGFSKHLMSGRKIWIDRSVIGRLWVLRFCNFD